MMTRLYITGMVKAAKRSRQHDSSSCSDHDDDECHNVAVYACGVCSTPDSACVTSVCFVVLAVLLLPCS